MIEVFPADVAMKFSDIKHSDYGSVLSMSVSMYKTELTQGMIKRIKTWVDGIEEGDVCTGTVKTKS